MAVARLQQRRHLGLRVRVTITITLIALVVSVLIAVTSVSVTRRNLVTERERVVTERALSNAKVVLGGLGSANTATEDLQTLLSSLPSAGSPSLLIEDPAGGSPRIVSVDSEQDLESIPETLRSQVRDRRQAGIMRYGGGTPMVAVGVPLPDRPASYFEIAEMSDIASALRTLQFTLAVVVLGVTLTGLGLGLWSSRRLLRPLAEIGGAAKAIAEGRLETRLEDRRLAADIDLGPLVESFNEMVAALQDRIERDARFASDVSHELRSPLTTINASISVLENNRDELPERACTALDLLSSDMERFTQLVEDLLEISRFDAGAVRLEIDEVAIVALVRAAVRATSHRPVPVYAEPLIEDLIVACDKRRLVRILANFVDNAEKYADGATGVFVEHDGDRVRIAVEDQGPGVPDAEKERIFDRFNRGDQGGSRGRDLGVGLGLALAAEHAHLMDGDVWVEDRPDGGTGARFVVELPFVEPTESAEGGLDVVLETGAVPVVEAES